MLHKAVKKTQNKQKKEFNLWGSVALYIMVAILQTLWMKIKIKEIR